MLSFIYFSNEILRVNLSKPSTFWTPTLVPCSSFELVFFFRKGLRSLYKFLNICHKRFSGLSCWRMPSWRRKSQLMSHKAWMLVPTLPLVLWPQMSHLTSQVLISSSKNSRSDYMIFQSHLDTLHYLHYFEIYPHLQVIPSSRSVTVLNRLTEFKLK